MDTAINNSKSVQTARKPGSLFWDIVVYGGTALAAAVPAGSRRRG